MSFILRRALHNLDLHIQISFATFSSAQLWQLLIDAVDWNATALDGNPPAVMLIL